jgi:hypothetical protein
MHEAETMAVGLALEHREHALDHRLGVDPLGDPGRRAHFVQESADQLPGPACLLLDDEERFTLFRGSARSRSGRKRAAVSGL